MVEKNNGLLMEPINKDDKDGHNSENKKAELIAVGRQLCREKKNDNALIIKKSTMPPGVQRVLRYMLSTIGIDPLEYLIPVRGGDPCWTCDEGSVVDATWRTDIKGDVEAGGKINGQMGLLNASEKAD
ncbi:hypothetical protein CFC21_019337 [Triticum aestivum]|uniref:Uncharacterized protein n=3 Tax=Triticum TaxID=4564 RepID=A0A9R1P5T2_TRITD|nr:hypothetical protein CFC21_019337 [Triticum aestivum]VAH37397.1 unnamed protein product [Triticum turgidum subsp. durum]